MDARFFLCRQEEAPGRLCAPAAAEAAGPGRLQKRRTERGGKGSLPVSLTWSFDLSDRIGLNAYTLTQSGSTMRTKRRIETYHQMLTILSGDLDLTQRDIAKQMGISLGKTNACLSELIQKKLVKVNPLRIPRNLYRQEDLATKGFLKIDRAEASQTKTNYLYVLTPEGLEEKYRMAQHLYEQKCSELERLKQQITDLKNEIELEAPRRTEMAT